MGQGHEDMTEKVEETVKRHEEVADEHEDAGERAEEMVKHLEAKRV